MLVEPINTTALGIVRNSIPKTSLEQRTYDQNIKIGKEIEKFLDGNCKWIKVSTLLEQHGITHRRLRNIVHLLGAPMNSKDFLDRRRSENIKQFLLQNKGDERDLAEAMGVNLESGVSIYLLRHFGITYGQCKYLQSINRAERFFEQNPDDYDEFLMDEISDFVVERNGFLNVEKDIKKEFNMDHSHTLYRIWRNFNPDLTLYDYITQVRVQYMRKQFLSHPTGLSEFLERHGYNRYTVNRLHKQHYGITFGVWVQAKVRGLPRVRLNGHFIYMDKEWLYKVYDSIVKGNLTAEQVAEDMGITVRSLRALVTTHAGKKFLDYAQDVQRAEKRKTYLTGLSSIC